VGVTLRYCSPEEVGLRGDRLVRAFEVADSYVGRAYPGYELVVLRDGCVAGRRVAGAAELVPTRREMVPDMLFDLASVTKALATSVVYARLVEEGLVSLRQPVVEIAPEFRYTVAGASPVKELVRVWMLLAHTSGLPAWLPLYRVARSRDEVFQEALRAFPAYEPGRAVTYSDINYIVLTYIAERVTGERFDRLFEKFVAKPLGLSRTVFNPLERGFDRGEVVATEVVEWRCGTLVGVVHDENAYAMGGVSGHAGLFSTAVESARIAWGVVEAYRGRDDTLISQASARTLLTTWACGEVCYGLGWQVYEPGAGGGTLVDLRPSRLFGHTGFTGTSVLVAPDAGLVVVFYTNRVHPSRSNEEIRVVRPLVHNAVLSSVRGW
jgi:CubicO group peptidase (beta-lactamase class C family)